MTDSSIGTVEQLKDPDYTPPIWQAIPLGFQQVSDALKFLGGTAQLLLSTALLPAAILAIVLNLVLPEEME